MKVDQSDGIRLLGDHLVVANRLPRSVGVLSGEIGRPGMWYGVLLPDGSVYGWYRVKGAAERYAAKIWGDAADDVARCAGVGNDRDGWREGCESCLRRLAPGGHVHMQPPAIIALWCEYHIEADATAHLPGENNGE